MPPALIAATPVGAVTTIRLGVSSLILWRKVVLPVPAFPVRKTLLLVLRTYSKASSSWGLETKLIDGKFAAQTPYVLKIAHAGCRFCPASASLETHPESPVKCVSVWRALLDKPNEVDNGPVLGADGL